MPRVVTRLFFLVILAFAAFTTSAQDFPVQHYKIEDGLPSNTVYEVYKDSKGYLWIATDKGIARYNGITFEIFNTSNGLPDNEILLFQEDPYGRLWLGTLNGERCFYKDGVFHTEANTPFLRLPFRTSMTHYIKVQPDSTVTICYGGTLVNYDKERSWIIHTDRKPYQGWNRSAYFQQVGKNRYDLCLVDVIYRIDSLGHVYDTKRAHSELTAEYLSQNNLYAKFGENLYNERLEFLVKIPDERLKSRGLNSFRIFEKDTFYMTNLGLDVNSNIHLFKGDPVSSVAIDKDHRYWVGTLKNGIYFLPSYYLHSSLYKNVFAGTVEYATAIKGGLFYVAERKVYNLLNGIHSTLFEFEHSDKPSAYYVDELKNGYKINETTLNVVSNLTSGKPTRKKYKVNSLSPKTLVVDSGRAIVRTRLTAGFFDLNSGQDSLMRVLQYDAGLNDKWQRVYCMAKAPTGNFWISTQDSMYELVGRQRKILLQFSNSALKTFAFVGNFLVGYTQKNKLIVCSNYLADVQKSEVRGHNCIWDQFYALDSTHLLISTSNKYRLFTVDKSHDRDHFNISVIEDPFIPLQADAICTDSFNCHFFKQGAITSIPLTSFYIRQTPPSLDFTFLKVGKEARPIDSIVKISYADSRNISIYFSTLSFSSKEVFYQYSISKDNVNNWRNLQGVQINLVNIGSGDYTVKVRARTISSKIGEPIVFRLSIGRPFWLSWWFISATLCVTALIIWIIVRRRMALALSKKQREHDTQVRFMKSEYKALNALMNPHFIFNTLNNVQSLVNSNDKLAANEYLRVFADLIRQNMHNVSKELIPLSKEMDLVKNYLMLEKLRFEDKLSYDIFIDDDLHLAEVMVPPLIFQPLVENAIKHGVLQLETRTGHVHIRIFEEADMVYMQVRDNGEGLNKAMESKDPAHESFGLENIRKRIDHLSIIQNKRISLEISEETNGNDGVRWTVASISMQA